MSSSKQIVDITDKAKEYIKHIFTNENPESHAGVRLSVVGGGCSGLSYKIDFGASKEKDNIFDYSDFKVFIDPKSAIYLSGVVLDYKDGLSGKGLVFDNPNAKNTCGCGESFSV